MADQSIPSTSDDAPLAGVAFVIAGLTIFSLQDVIVKSLSDAYPAHQIVFLRGLVGLLPILLLIRFESGTWSLRNARPYLCLLRGLLGFVCFMSYYLAVAALPLAVAVTLFFASPLFVTGLVGPVLGEKVGWRRWLAVLAGFAGVVAIVRPADGSFDPAMGFGVFAALSYAAMVLLTRIIGKSVSGSTMSLYSMLVFIAASGLLGLLLGDGSLAGGGHPSGEFLLRAWAWPTWRDAGLIAVCGVIAGLGIYFLTKSVLGSPSPPRSRPSSIARCLGASSGAMSSRPGPICRIRPSGWAIGSLAGGGHPSGEFLLRAWAWPTWRDAGLIAVCGVIAGLGFYFLTQAYRVSKPSTVAPFEYCALPWGVLWGYVFWSDLPDTATWLGIGLIAGAGLYIAHREGIRGRRVASSRPLRPKI